MPDKYTPAVSRVLSKKVTWEHKQREEPKQKVFHWEVIEHQSGLFFPMVWNDLVGVT